MKYLKFNNAYLLRITSIREVYMILADESDPQSCLIVYMDNNENGYYEWFDHDNDAKMRFNEISSILNEVTE